ncbi:MAG: hypothetical protein WDO13_21560 [Verrucomicrobiota bacterium]
MFFGAQDGLFHLFSTDGWNSSAFVHASSPDLIEWSAQRLIPIMESIPGVKNVWAPECFFEHETGCYRVLWSSTVGGAEYDHRIWSSTSRDLETFSPPQLFIDPGFNVIDATIRP